MPIASITRRLIGAVLLIELLAALSLIAAMTVTERSIRYKEFDANLRATTHLLFGAVQDAEDQDDNIMLDMHGIRLPSGSIFRVIDEKGRVLGSAGEVPALPNDSESFHHVVVHERSYRFFTMSGERVIDPGAITGGVHHQASVIYGQPDGHVWHEVLESIRSFALATVFFLGMTATILVWLIQRFLAPIRDLAKSADQISTTRWAFEAPKNASQFVELRPLSAAIERTIARLHQSFELQKRFTRDAAHELKTDLAIVKSSLQLLLMRQRTTEEYEQGLLLGLDDLGRLEQTVREMLTLARLEQPVTYEEHCNVDIAIQEAIFQSRPYADLRDIELATELADSVVVPIDSRDAVLLCSNLVMNALQHSPERSTVVVSLTAANREAVFFVRDHGEGINNDEREVLFEPFYRGDPSRSRKSGGTGLGLSICKAICDRIGATIEISNHVDGGALVTVTLPVSITSPKKQLRSVSLKH